MNTPQETHSGDQEMGKALPSDTTTNKWQVSHYYDGELYKISLFFKQFYGVVGSYGNMGMFHWKIKANPTKEGKINLVKDGDKIASTTSLTPKTVFIKGIKTIAAEIGDTYTDPKYQRQGMFAMLINQTRKNGNDMGIQLIYGTPNDQSLPGYQKKANFDVIPGREVRQLVFPLHIGPYLQKKGVPSVLATPLCFIYRKTKKWQLRSTINIPNLNCDHISSIEQLGNEFNQFWETAKQNYDFILDRSPSALKWRFFDSPNTYQFFLLRDSEKIIGYFVTRTVVSETGCRTVIADYLVLNDFSNKLKSNLKNFIAINVNNKSDFIEAWSIEGSTYYEILKSLGFVDRNKINIICHKNHQTNHLKQTERWHFTVSDTDNI